MVINRNRVIVTRPCLISRGRVSSPLIAMMSWWTSQSSKCGVTYMRGCVHVIAPTSDDPGQAHIRAYIVVVVKAAPIADVTAVRSAPRSRSRAGLRLPIGVSTTEGPGIWSVIRPVER